MNKEIKKDTGYKSKYKVYIEHLESELIDSSAEVYSNCIGPVNERKDEETDWQNYLLSNLQTSHQLLVFPNLNKGFLRLTLTDVSGNDIVINCEVGSREKPEEQSCPCQWCDFQ